VYELKYMPMTNVHVYANSLLSGPIDTYILRTADSNYRYTCISSCCFIVLYNCTSVPQTEPQVPGSSSFALVVLHDTLLDNVSV